MRELREIPRFSGYLIGNDGSVWTLKRKGGNDRGPGRRVNPRRLKTHRNGSGYATVNLDLAGKVRSVRVHRLVLEAFVGPSPPGYCGCHYPDTKKSNNRIENLRWDSPAENAKDRYRDHARDAPKRCCRCKGIKSHEEFYSDNRSSDGLQSECKRCHSSVAMATRDARKKRAANRAYMTRCRDNNPNRWR